MNYNPHICDSNGMRPSVNAALPELASPDAKTISTFAAKFAIAGHELIVVRKDCREYYEVRAAGECRTCSTLHDLEGLLAQVGVAS